MAETSPTPVGVVAVITFPDGTVLASASDFETSSPGGFTLNDAQTMRAKQSVKWAAVRALCHPDVPDALSSYEVEKIAEGLIRKKSYRLSVIPVGQEAEHAQS